MKRELGPEARTKFTIGLNDFGDEAIRRKAQEARRPTFSQEEMAASRQTGFEEGRIAGTNEAIASQESQIRDLLQQVVMSIERLSQDETDRLATFIDQAALIAVQALVKTLPALLEVLAVGQIASFVTQVLEEEVKSQAVTIYVHPSREQALRERMENVITQTRRKHPAHIQADATLHDLQCRIEWSGGGADWLPDQVAAKLLHAILSQLPEPLKQQALMMDEPAQNPHTAAEETPA